MVSDAGSVGMPGGHDALARALGSTHENPRYIVFNQRDDESAVVGLGDTLKEARRERDDAGQGFIWDSEKGRWIDG